MRMLTCVEALGVVLALIPAQSAQAPATYYTHVQVRPFEVSRPLEVPPEFHDALLSALVAALRKTNLFVDVVGPGESLVPDVRALRLLGRITAFDPGNQEVRRRIGLGFGTTRMKVRFAFVDASTCAVILEGTADGKVVGGWGGGESLGATRGVAKEVATRVARMDRRVAPTGSSCEDPVEASPEAVPPAGDAP
jgi:hypothetical protein